LVRCYRKRRTYDAFGKGGWMRYLIAIALLLSLMRGTCATQQAAIQHASTSRRSTASKPKFSSRQLQALKILARAETRARSLPAPDRSALLYQIVVAYGRLTPAKRRQLAISAFEASVAMDDVEPQTWQQPQPWGIKNYIQNEILDLLNESPADVERLLPQAIPELRHEFTASLAARYAERKQFGRAIRLLHAAAGQGEFPYSAAATVLLYLPPEKSSERLNIFTEALNAYSQSSESYHMAYEDLATVVIRFWQDLPVPLVTQAVDTILDRAKDAADSHPFQMQIRSRHGNAAFASEWDFRLFQLLPVLEQIDPSRAALLLRENPSVQNLLQRYPAGMRSFDSGLTGKPGPNGQRSENYNVELHNPEGRTGSAPCGSRFARATEDHLETCHARPEAGSAARTQLRGP